MKKVLFFTFIAALLLALWANHTFGEDRAVNPASGLPSVPVGTPTHPEPPKLSNPASALPAVPTLPLFELRDFSGGLNLKSPTTELAPNEALVCQNWLFDRERGLVVRPGFGKVNTDAIDLSSIWGLYHYSIPNYGKGFLVGDSTWIYKITDAGSFADSQIYMDELQGDFTSGDSRVNIDQPVDFFNIERKICRGDKVSFGATEYEIKQVVYDTTATARYKLELTAAAGATVSNQVFRIKASNATADKGHFLQRNNTVFFSMGGRQNARWRGKLSDIVGIYGQGKIDTVYFSTPAASKHDTALVCNSCNFTTDELAGKILAFSAVVYNGRYDSTRRIVTEYRIVRSNTSGEPARIYYGKTHLDTGVQVGRLQPFLIFDPLFTVVDSGTVDTIYNEVVVGNFAIRDAGKNFSDKHLYAGKIIEFLDGAARGIINVIDGGVRGALGDTLRFTSAYSDRIDSTNLPKKGDHYAIYHLGVQASIAEFYYDRYVLAGIPNFPNTIRPSESGNPDSYLNSDYLTLPEQGGDSIVALVNAGNLWAFQKQRIWTLIGPPPWTGQTVVLTSDGVGCIAPRSIVRDGDWIYFVGLRGNIPTVFRRHTGSIAPQRTTAGGTVFEGEGALQPLTVKIDPLMMKVNRSKLDKISAGLFGEHLLVSLPFGTSTVNDSTIAINLRTGAIGLWTLAGGLWHNGRAAGDSGQIYFTSANESGWVYLFGGATDSLDLGQTFTALWQSGWMDFGAPTVLKQGLRLWAGYFRSNTSGTSIWKVRTDFTTTDQHTFTTTTTAGERDENQYVGVAALGKRFGLRFEGAGIRGSFVLKGLTLKLALRGEAQ